MDVTKINSYIPEAELMIAVGSATKDKTGEISFEIIFWEQGPLNVGLTCIVVSGGLTSLFI